MHFTRGNYVDYDKMRNIRLVLQLPARASVAAAMRDTLHWLSFPHRVTYKLCFLTYKCLHGLAPVVVLCPALNCHRSIASPLC